MHGIVRKGVIMRQRTSFIGTLVCGLALTGGFASAETIEEVGKKIAAASEKTKSFSAKTKMVTEMKQPGFSMTSTNQGTTEMLRKGETFLIRMENKGVTQTDVGGNVTEQETSVLTINDEAFSYTYSEAAGMKSAQKTKLGKPPTDPFAGWRESADLKVLPDATVEGLACWVLEATPKTAEGQGKSVMHFHKDSGQMLKMVTYAPDGKPMNTMTFTDIKINGAISPDRFVFKAPPGVEVLDLSK